MRNVRHHREASGDDQDQRKVFLDPPMRTDGIEVIEHRQNIAPEQPQPPAHPDF
jgi:hypothetical protein